MGLFSEKRNTNYVSQTQLGEPRNQLACALWLTDNFRCPKTNHLIAKRLQDGIAGIILGHGFGTIEVLTPVHFDVVALSRHAHDEEIEIVSSCCSLLRLLFLVPDPESL